MNTASAAICNCSMMYLSGDMSADDYMEWLEILYGEDLRQGIEEAIMNEDSDKLNELMKEIQENAEDYDEAGEAQPPRDPLIIDFGESGIQLHSLENGVNFDLDNNGFAEKTAWIGVEDGFLALDRNGNGTIDNGSELFGDQVILKDGSKSESGFEALAEGDDNEDGIIDGNDMIFADLKIWVDSDHNGISESDEITALDKVGIVSISLEHTEESFVDEETGTRIAESSTVAINANGTEVTAQISEFWFPVNSSDTTQGGTVTAGNVPSIVQAIADDESGELFELCYEFSEADDIALKRYYIKQILYFITDSNDIAINSRGGNIDARDLNVIEQFMGRDFVGVGGANPNSNAAAILKNIYIDIENQYYNIMNMYSALGGYMHSVYESVDDNGNKSLDLALLNYIIDTKIADGENVDTLIYDLGVYLKSYDEMNGTRLYADYTAHYSSMSAHYADIVDLTKSGFTYLGTQANESYNGTGGNDFIFGENGKDTLNGSNGNDIIYGGEGNDSLNGGTEADKLYGEGGDDHLYGNGGNDILDSGEGNDFIYGGSGNDIYIFNVGYGTDVIKDGEGINTIRFGREFNADLLTAWRTNWNDLAIIFANAEDKLIIQDYFVSEANRKFNTEFADGSKFTFEAIENPINHIHATEYDDWMTSWSDNGIVLYGDGGNDTLNGGDGDDILDGGIGDDYLSGGNGNDKYVIGNGGGSVIIEDADGLKGTVGAETGEFTEIIQEEEAEEYEA